MAKTYWDTLPAKQIKLAQEAEAHRLPAPLGPAAEPLLPRADGRAGTGVEGLPQPRGSGQAAVLLQGGHRSRRRRPGAPPQAGTAATRGGPGYEEGAGAGGQVVQDGAGPGEVPAAAAVRIQSQPRPLHHRPHRPAHPHLLHPLRPHPDPRVRPQDGRGHRPAHRGHHGQRLPLRPPPLLLDGLLHRGGDGRRRRPHRGRQGAGFREDPGRPGAFQGHGTVRARPVTATTCCARPPGTTATCPRSRSSSWAASGPRRACGRRCRTCSGR